MKLHTFKHFLTLAGSVAAGVFLVAGVVSAATTISTNISTGGTLDVTGLSTLTAGFVSNASSTVAATLNTVTASTSALIVGDEPSTTINGIAFGYCSFGLTTAFVGSTTRYVDCTTTPTNVLTSSDRIFVMATSSFDADFIIQAASSTSGGSTITMRIYNTGHNNDQTLASTSVNFIAIR